MTVTRVSTPAPMADQVFAIIHEAIMSGDMPAGYRLRVRDLADLVGTSVMPVREAIRRLEEAGLAEREPNKGAVVRALSAEELTHVYEVRRVLEAEAAREGARAIDADGVATMQRHHERMVAAVARGDLVGALDADEAMLETLYGAGGNPVLLDTIRGLWHRCRAYKIAGAGYDTAWSQFQPRILAAARENDARAAAALTQQSLRAAGRRIKRQLDEVRTASAPTRRRG